MKTFSFAAITGALMFTSSFAMADPRPGPECFHGHARYHGGYSRPGIVVRGPSLSILPRVVLPSPAVVFAPRAPVVSHRHHGVNARPSWSPAPVVNVRPSPSPVVASAPVSQGPRSGDGKPAKSGGGGKPSKPGR